MSKVWDLFLIGRLCTSLPRISGLTTLPGDGVPESILEVRRSPE